MDRKNTHNDSKKFNKHHNGDDNDDDNDDTDVNNSSTNKTTTTSTSSKILIFFLMLIALISISSVVLSVLNFLKIKILNPSLKYFNLSYELDSGLSSPETSNLADCNIRNLNNLTTNFNETIDKSLVAFTKNAGEFLLSKGTWSIVASAPAFRASSHQIRLFNVTDKKVTVVGTTEYCQDSIDAAGVMTRSFLNSTFDLLQPTLFRIEHKIQNTTDYKNIFGTPLAASKEIPEVYTIVSLQQIK